ncbi:sec1 family domain-containing protein 2-like [Chelonus insularis]|uniref:sec1 family domain-containing protein 2-like n=1 Tax=Chelonus insularis TaxID=460826 RepID=UPI0015896B9C|nr:sec1 family domain-containing protein 2-like [Chelonus insularis]
MTKKYEISEFADACWQDVLSKIQGAAVYIDHPAIECLHWLKGDRSYLSLIAAGAHSVHEMAMFNFQYVKVHGTDKAVIITTSIDSAFYHRTLNIIIQKNTFDTCTIICAIHHSILPYTSGLEGDDNSYEMLKKNILSCMNDTEILKKPFVEIIFRPIFIAPITKNVFVAPPIDKLLPPVDGNISDDYVTNVKYFVSLLHSLFTHFNVKEDIYFMGKFSEYVAEELINLPAAIDRRNRLIGSSGVTLILVDRTLDLCTATKNNTECILSRVLSTLPHLPCHKNDVAVNMTPLCPDLAESPLSMTVPGCIATDNNEVFNILISKKQKDVLLTLNKWLFEMASTEILSLKAKLSLRISAHSLEKLLHKVRDSLNITDLAKNSKKLQIIMAVIQALKSEKTAALELLISLEKLILQNLAISRESTTTLSQISSIIKTRSTKGLDMENLFVLLIHIYSLSGTEIHFTENQENQLRSSLKNAIFEDIKKCNEIVTTHEVSVYQQTLLLLGVSDKEAAERSAEIITNHVMDVLHAVAEQRKSLSNYGSMITKSSPQEMAESFGLVERLLNDVLHPNKPEIKDLRQKNSSLISAGISLLLKGRTTHHPTDNPWILIYILGGITPEEIKIVKEIINQKSNIPQITLAGCRLLNPSDIGDNILWSSSINI